MFGVLDIYWDISSFMWQVLLLHLCLEEDLIECGFGNWHLNQLVRRESLNVHCLQCWFLGCPLIKHTWRTLHQTVLNIYLNTWMPRSFSMLMYCAVLQLGGKVRYYSFFWTCKIIIYLHLSSFRIEILWKTKKNNKVQNFIVVYSATQKSIFNKIRYISTWK